MTYIPASGAEAPIVLTPEQNAADAKARAAAVAGTGASYGGNVPTRAPSAASQTPSAVFSSNEAQDFITQKILPSLNKGSAAIAGQNALMAAKNSVDGVDKNYQIKPGESTATYQSRIDSYNASKTGKTEPPVQQSDPVGEILNTPDPGNQWIYDANGQKTQNPIGNVPPGFTAAPPVKNPVDAKTPVLTEFFGADGAKYQAYNDGSYGKLDPNGNFIGNVSGGEFTNAHTASPTGIIEGLRADMLSVTKGTYPLTPIQTAQVNGLNAQFDDLLKQQKTANENLTGGTTVAMNLYGMGNSLSGLSTIQATVTSGISKISSLQTQAAKAVADMQSSFQEDNMKNLLNSYNSFKDAQDEMQAHFDKIQEAVAKKAEEDRNYNLSVKKFEQDAKNSDRTYDLDVKKEAFDEAYKREDLALKHRANSIAESQLNVPVVNVGTDGSPDPKAQKDFLATLPPATATAVKALTDYTFNPASLSSRAGPNGGPSQRQQMITLAHQFDPNYDENQYAARAAYLKNLQAGQMSQGIAAGNKAIQHLVSFTNSLEAVNNGGVSSKLNAVHNTLNAPMDKNLQKNLTEVNAKATAVSDELAKFFKGTGASDVNSIESWEKKLNPNATPSERKGLVEGAIELLGGQLTVMEQQYTTTMGKPPALNKILQADTINKLSDLKNRGYKVDIPGVLYTDKDAFLRSEADGTTKLKSAYDILISQGYEATPENVLQAAQILN